MGLWAIDKTMANSNSHNQELNHQTNVEKPWGFPLIPIRKMITTTLRWLHKISTVYTAMYIYIYTHIVIYMIIINLIIISTVCETRRTSKHGAGYDCYIAFLKIPEINGGWCRWKNHLFRMKSSSGLPITLCIGQSISPPKMVLNYY